MRGGPRREHVHPAARVVHGHHAGMQSQAISITFAARAQPDAPRRFSGVAYSGGVIPHYGWLGDVAIDLATLQNAQGDALPILVDHDQRIDAIAGRGRIFKAADAQGLPFLAVEGEISQATEAGRKVAALFAEGHPVQLSVGMHANVREVSEPVSVNGRSMKVAALFENAVVREVSFVAVGADPDTQAHAFAASAAAPKPSKETSPMSEDKPTVEALQARIAELEAQIEAARIERRRADLAALFEAVGRDAPSDDKPYIEMSDAAFAAFAADLKAVAKPARDASLFSAASLAKAGKGGEPQDASRARVDALMSAVKQITA
jgi:phage head maturation protease